MVYINLIVVFTLLIFGIALLLLRNSYTSNLGEIKTPKFTNQMILMLVLFIGLVIRIICAYHYAGHEDLNCFRYWGQSVFQNGFSKFYQETSFADYPPGYMYVLYILEGIMSLFKVAQKTVASGMILKSVPMLCDMITAVIIYKIARKRLNSVPAYIMLGLYLFNPAVILNSAAWGQVDSVFFLGILLMCYYATTKKNVFAYIAYFAAILIKPQAIMFTPVLMFMFAQDVFINQTKKDKIFSFNKKQLIRHLKWIIASVLGSVLICLPFGLETVIKKYATTMGSYKYASVNAYNFWSMLGLDWKDQTTTFLGVQYQQWGILIIVLIVIVAAFIWISKWKDNNRYVMIAIFICASMFTFAVRMHERYVYPAVILLLLYYILTKDIYILGVYAVYTIIHFYNCSHVLFFYDANNFDARNGIIISVSLLHVIVYGILFRYIYNMYIAVNVNKTVLKSSSEAFMEDKNECENDRIGVFKRIKKIFFKDTIAKSKKLSQITKYDVIIMLIITIIYSAIALYDLGDRQAPEKFWTNKNDNTIRLEFEKKTDISKIAFYNGYEEECEYTLRLSSGDEKGWIYDSSKDLTKDEETKEPQSKYMMKSVFKWDYWNLNMKCKYIELVAPSDTAVIGELVIIDKKGNIVKPKNADSKECKGLFDEQRLYPKKSTFRNSTYFDEIYHARTAYEMVHGLRNYEWTHPPLGKFFISLGIRMFGMCPFGWRIIGTIFGILMVPAIYLFAKRMFNKTSFATIACILFTFDFMHFAQTRIATIDVYVTFFVILMYYFMYKYYCMSFNDTKLSKTFVPLLLSGISMGLGCASKWTGCYAAAGLAVIFFSTVFKRTHEYKLAKNDIDGETNGIKHRDVVDGYKGKLTKTILFCCLAFIIIPCTIYTLSYIPFVGDSDAPSSLFGRMIENQKDMYTYHTNIKFEHGFSSRWYEWALMIRPIFYYSGEMGQGYGQGISSFGNPFVWWVGIGAFVYITYRMLTKKDRNAMFLFIGYLAQLLPWILVERLTFIYHYFPSVPFVVLMNVYMIACLIKDNPKYRKYAYLYAGLVIITFIAFYPVLSGQTVSNSYVDTWLKWIPSWVF